MLFWIRLNSHVTDIGLVILWSFSEQVPLLDLKKKDDCSFPTGTISFPSFKDDPVSAVKQLYQQVALTMAPEFEKKLSEQSIVEAHERCTLEHSYTNPTLESMGVDQDSYLSLPGVRQYKKCLEEMLKDQ